MRLVHVVVGILAYDHGFDGVEGRVSGPRKGATNRMISEGDP